MVGTEMVVALGCNAARHRAPGRGTCSPFPPASTARMSYDQCPKGQAAYTTHYFQPTLLQALMFDPCQNSMRTDYILPLWRYNVDDLVRKVEFLF